eukprot:CAMPEP_0202689740 /NCGR_PEP_ID=MMETSP1385-20130828/4935_1 /ASSEMBLY_ACC=CAM_ASM_000861 /TAXON_ID=933848 /ORGANISM="Elphidium margaritaceum" /LENGTH=214 /DNA_ID=CAMNT_0049344919 /DNA_START=31 /DNA_END=675 /DNA_ORIENTATION=+
MLLKPPPPPPRPSTNGHASTVLKQASTSIRPPPPPPKVVKNNASSHSIPHYRSWNRHAIIFWLNRVNGGMLAHIEYLQLRKHIFIGKIKGAELPLINDVILRMIGIFDDSHQREILDTIAGLTKNITVKNVMAQTLKTDDIPHRYCDQFTYEIMHDPVRLTVSGNFYDRQVIQTYLQRFAKDPITQQSASLPDIVPQKELKQELEAWKVRNFQL